MTSFKIIRTIYKSKVNYIPKLDFITWYRAPCGFEMYVVHFTIFSYFKFRYFNGHQPLQQNQYWEPKYISLHRIALEFNNFVSFLYQFRF